MGRVDITERRWIPLLMAFAVALSVVVFANPAPAQARVSVDAFEQCLLDQANQARAAVGAAPLQMAADIVPDVRAWSKSMRFNDFEHMPQQRRQDILPDDWTRWGENIAMHSNDGMADCRPIHTMWMNSEGHRKNILQSDFRFVAIGAYVDGSGWWATQVFFDARDYSPTCEGTFCDDDGSGFEADIEKIAAAGITGGCNPPTNTRFCPNDRVTRGQMAAFLTRALGLTSTGNVDFSDDNRSVFEADIQKIATAGITQGCNPPSNTRFCPDDYVTRGQMAAFLTRALP